MGMRDDVDGDGFGYGRCEERKEKQNEEEEEWLMAHEERQGVGDEVWLREYGAISLRCESGHEMQKQTRDDAFEASSFGIRTGQ
jgi:hypothetical protein